jgi:hypothetical protein
VAVAADEWRCDSEKLWTLDGAGQYSGGLGQIGAKLLNCRLVVVAPRADEQRNY